MSCSRSCEVSVAVTHHGCPKTVVIHFCISLCTWSLSFILKYGLLMNFFVSWPSFIFQKSHYFSFAFFSNMNPIHTHMASDYKVNTYVEECEITVLIIPALSLHMWVSFFNST